MTISIVTVCKNAEKQIEATILSVLTQSYPHIEYIVIDGASRDATMSVINIHKDKIAKISSEPDRGIYDAMNKGIRSATGDYLLFLNSGDRLAAPDVIEKMVHHIEVEGHRELYHALMFIEQTHGRMAGQEFESVVPWKLFFWNIPHPAIFYRRDLFERYGTFNEDLRIAGDYEYLLRLLIASSVGSRYVPLVITSFDINGMSALPENKVLMRREIETIRRRYFSGVYCLLNRSELLEKFARAFMKRLLL